jgi:hypothetical protein
VTWDNSVRDTLTTPLQRLLHEKNVSNGLSAIKSLVDFLDGANQVEKFDSSWVSVPFVTLACRSLVCSTDIGRALFYQP